MIPPSTIPPPPASSRRSRKNGENGFSLVEVLLASAMLATVLLAIAGLFIYGGERIKSGKLLSKATAYGMDIMEDFRQMPFETTFRVLNANCGNQDPCTGNVTATWNTKMAIPSWSAENSPSATEFQKILDQWKADFHDTFGVKATQIASGDMTVKVDGFKNVPVSTQDGDTCFCAARFLRVRITVTWFEARNHKRKVTFETLKF